MPWGIVNTTVAYTTVSVSGKYVVYIVVVVVVVVVVARRSILFISSTV